MYNPFEDSTWMNFLKFQPKILKDKDEKEYLIEVSVKFGMF